MILQNMNDANLLLLRKKDLKIQEVDVSSDFMSNEDPEEHWCRYSIQQGTTSNLIGLTQVPLGMDVDDAFPPFHAANFDERAKDALVEAIRDGGLLIAESNFEPPSLLAYRLNDPDYWYGREETLKYLGVINFRRAC